MKKKILIGITGFLTFSEAQSDLLNDLSQSNIVEELEIEELQLSEQNNEIITDFINDLKAISAFKELEYFKIKKHELIKNNNKYQVVISMESKYKEAKLYFPAEYKDNKIIKITPIYYDSNTGDIVSFTKNIEFKKMTKNTLENIVKKENIMTLNNIIDNTSENFLFINIDSDLSLAKYLELFNNDGSLKSEYSKTKINLVLISFEDFLKEDTKYLTGLIKEVYKKTGKLDHFYNYLIEKKNIDKKLRQTFIENISEGFEDNYLNKYYSELSNAENDLIKKHISILEKNTEANKENLIKREINISDVLLQFGNDLTESLTFTKNKNNLFEKSN